jgi:hypothetical protein
MRYATTSLSTNPTTHNCIEDYIYIDYIDDIEVKGFGKGFCSEVSASSEELDLSPAKVAPMASGDPTG